MTLAGVTPLENAGEGGLGSGGIIDTRNGQTTTIEIIYAKPGAQLKVYAFGGPHFSWGRDYPSWWPNYPAPLATLTTVGQTYTVTSRVWVEDGDGAPPTNSSDIRARVRRVWA